MSDRVISVEHLCKSYRLGVIGTGTFYGDLKRWWARQRGKPDPYRRIGDADHGNRLGETIWALQDIDFGVRQGEAVGIVGRNGAGKSTLLKVLSRVTAPTSGIIKIKGRIASLLEVGTGFHSELTGRENIFLNGAIMGMSRQEIQHKLDEIVDFAGVEKFIDTPVKRYSSGMYVRLAFAVAAHLDPEILVVDEVLAVGDAQFQKKSLGKMGEVSGQGRTLLFVSHNMGMITSLCQRAILLDAGSIVIDGDVPRAVAGYFNNTISSPYVVDFTRLPYKIGDEHATLLAAQIEDESGQIAGEIDIHSSFKVKMKYALHDAVPGSPYPNFHFYNSQGQCAFVTSGERAAHQDPNGVYEAACIVPGSLLNNDTYSIDLALTFTHNGIQGSFWQRGALVVVIRDNLDETLDEERQGYGGAIPGAVRPNLNWEIKNII